MIKSLSVGQSWHRSSSCLTLISYICLVRSQFHPSWILRLKFQIGHRSVVVPDLFSDSLIQEWFVYTLQNSCYSFLFDFFHMLLSISLPLHPFLLSLKR